MFHKFFNYLMKSFDKFRNFFIFFCTINISWETLMEPRVHTVLAPPSSRDLHLVDSAVRMLVGDEWRKTENAKGPSWIYPLHRQLCLSSFILNGTGRATPPLHFLSLLSPPPFSFRLAVNSWGALVFIAGQMKTVIFFFLLSPCSPLASPLLLRRGLNVYMSHQSVKGL